MCPFAPPSCRQTSGLKGECLAVDLSDFDVILMSLCFFGAESAPRVFKMGVGQLLIGADNF